MMSLPVINLEDYSYHLPAGRIAQHPLPERDASKILVRNRGMISEDLFRNIARYLPGESLLVFNNTKVIRARLLFRKSGGALMEVFCLEPMYPTREIHKAFQQRGHTTWGCLIGQARKWKGERLQMEIRTDGHTCFLFAEKGEALQDGVFTVSFSWQPAFLTFGEILEKAGRIPLPPYIKREADPADLIRYQTIYARHQGSVAAPTAGLHFTQPVMDSLKARKIRTEAVTLHVGLGTFRPVTSPDLTQHTMHREQIVVEAKTIRNLLACSGKPLIAVGTTSVRTLESLYWLGVKYLADPGGNFTAVGQWDPYVRPQPPQPGFVNALESLLEMMHRRGVTQFTADTRLMITPGYVFRMIDGMITNFHQPRSTLLLLVAAYLGAGWKEVYHYALAHQFRFLSYGDACLFLEDQPGRK